MRGQLAKEASKNASDGSNAASGDTSGLCRYRIFFQDVGTASGFLSGTGFHQWASLAHFFHFNPQVNKMTHVELRITNHAAKIANLWCGKEHLLV